MMINTKMKMTMMKMTMKMMMMMTTTFFQSSQVSLFVGGTPESGGNQSQHFPLYLHYTNRTIENPRMGRACGKGCHKEYVAFGCISGAAVVANWMFDVHHLQLASKGLFEHILQIFLLTCLAAGRETSRTILTFIMNVHFQRLLGSALQPSYSGNLVETLASNFTNARAGPCVQEGYLVRCLVYRTIGGFQSLATSIRFSCSRVSLVFLVPCKVFGDSSDFNAVKGCCGLRAWFSCYQLGEVPFLCHLSTIHHHSPHTWAVVNSFFGICKPACWTMGRTGGEGQNKSRGPPCRIPKFI